MFTVHSRLAGACDRVHLSARRLYFSVYGKTFPRGGGYLTIPMPVGTNKMAQRCNRTHSSDEGWHVGGDLSRVNSGGGGGVRRQVI